MKKNTGQNIKLKRGLGVNKNRRCKQQQQNKDSISKGCNCACSDWLNFIIITFIIIIRSSPEKTLILE